jgi:undecaprenyl-diphosphatase
VLVGVALIVTGCIVFTTRWTAAAALAPAPSWKAVIAIGFAQSLAILPGISRSGSTVAMGLALGVAPRAAAEFSFLLGIIAIAGAAVLMLPDLSHAGTEALGQMGLGAVTALASGLLAIWLFVRMLDRSLFHHWAWYCWAVGFVFLTWSLG